FFDLHRAAGAVVEQLAGADGDDRAAGGLVFGGVGNVDAAGGLLFHHVAFDDNLVADRLEDGFGLLLRGDCGHGFFSWETCVDGARGALANLLGWCEAVSFRLSAVSQNIACLADSRELTAESPASAPPHYGALRDSWQGAEKQAARLNWRSG